MTHMQDGSCLILERNKCQYAMHQKNHICFLPYDFNRQFQGKLWASGVKERVRSQSLGVWSSQRRPRRCRGDACGQGRSHCQSWSRCCVALQSNPCTQRNPWDGHPWSSIDKAGRPAEWDSEAEEHTMRSYCRRTGNGRIWQREWRYHHVAGE